MTVLLGQLVLWAGSAIVMLAASRDGPPAHKWLGWFLMVLGVWICLLGILARLALQMLL